MTRDVLEYASKKFGTQKIHLLAHSMGGKVAMNLALSHQEKLSKLIVVDMSPRPYPLSATMKGYIVSMMEIQALRLTSVKEADVYLQRTIPEKSIRSFLLTNLKKTDGVYQFRINLQSLLKNYDRLGDWDHPHGTTSSVETLFLAGRKSEYIAGSAELSSVFPNSVCFCFFSPQDAGMG
jgi:pimeloyl-ACP methyl ester carboxylesterase